MKRNHFMVSYVGNKRTEVKKILDSVDLENIKYIIEPYCGTSAFSYYVWKNHPNGKDMEYILNDNDSNLIELYKIAQDDKKWEELIKSVNDTCFVDDEFKISKEDYLKIINDGSFKGWFISRKFYNIRYGLYPLNRKKTTRKLKNNYCDEFREFLKNGKIKLLNKDGVDIIKKYEMKEKAFIFLDPPYLNVNNQFYQCGGSNVYEYLSDRKIDYYKCYLCAVLNDTWVSRLIFRQYKIIEYDKLYKPSKKKVIHLLITNRD